ncbi:effector binding domain-containing protein, partial [Roseofilum reptotaenium CS-1145]|uniref:GyrI-like domain-containing protein n=1 Tax=Roseofilum reptotaenium TaxID=1233427 RepID=UPI0023309F93
WLQYAESETLFSLENTVDNKTYVAYLNYSENRDRFTIIIGHRVANFEAVPVGLSQIIIPATTYAQFNITGNLDEAIPKTWEAIERSNLKRAYSTDLEVYDYQQENVAEIWASVN